MKETIKILAIVGARPQFIKHAPIIIKAQKHFKELNIHTLHTGQHYDDNMSAVFFNQLNMPHPEYMLNIGSHSHGKQTAMMIEQIEEVVIKNNFNGMLVYGDTNSTLAGALVGSKLNIPIFHIEAGLRSYNKTMPEEINRILTDHVSALLFAPTEVAVKNLIKEGLQENIIKTGDIMFDMLQIAEESGILSKTEEHEQFILCTIHRPYNTDDPNRLKDIFRILNAQAKKAICPLHPRTRHLMSANNISLADYENIKFMEPVSYFENINLIYNSSAVITDSGGMQKEAYMLKKKCITLRTETEWTETLTNGWNHLVFDDLNSISLYLSQLPTDYTSNLYGDGNASEFILNKINDFYS